MAYNQPIYVERAMTVTFSIEYDPASNEWIVFDHEIEEVGRYDSENEARVAIHSGKYDIG